MGTTLGLCSPQNRETHSKEWMMGKPQFDQLISSKILVVLLLLVLFLIWAAS